MNSGAPASWNVSVSARSARSPQSGPSRRSAAIAMSATKKIANTSQRESQVLDVSSAPEIARTSQPGGKRRRALRRSMFSDQPTAGNEERASSSRDSAVIASSAVRISTPRGTRAALRGALRNPDFVDQLPLVAQLYASERAFLHDQAMAAPELAADVVAYGIAGAVDVEPELTHQLDHVRLGFRFGAAGRLERERLARRQRIGRQIAPAAGQRCA